jgi:hypothetical protein
MATPARIAAALLLLATYTQYTTAFHPRSITHQSRVVVPSSLLSLRGGSDSDHDSEYDSEEEEEEPIIQKTKALASSTKSKLQKTKNASVKSAAAKAMSSSKPIKTSGGNSVAKLYRRMVPHIIRACLNPFTFVRMSRAYFASLLDINYMKEVRAGFGFCRCLL